MRIRVDGAAIMVWVGVYEGAIQLERALSALVVWIAAYVASRIASE